ncbi:hypothetical protein M758_UG072900 [Ceratodon purpureus]|nr:hypothetical protein M758_UG072900 [Ceratodon purpureus]
MKLLSQGWRCLSRLFLRLGIAPLTSSSPSLAPSHSEPAMALQLLHSTIHLTGGVIRQQLYEMLKDEQGVRFEEGASAHASSRG